MPFVFALTLLYVALVYLRPQEYVPDLQGIPILAMLMAIAAAAWLPQRDKLLATPQHRLLPVYVVVLMVSIAVNGWLGGVMKALGDMGPELVLFFLVSTSVVTVPRHRKFVATVGAATTVLAIHGIDQSAKGIGWSGAELSQGTRITYLGIFNDPNDLGLAFVVAVPMVAYCVTNARNMFARLAWVAALGTIYYGIYLTNSRGAMLAAMAQAFVFLSQRYGKVAAALGALAGAAGLSMLPSRLSELDADEHSAAGRVDAWYIGLQLFFYRPLFGVGFGMFGEHHNLTAHNSMVMVFAESGFAGYYPWLAFMALSFYMVWRAARAPVAAGPDAALHESYRRVALAYCYALFGYFIAAFFLSRVYNPVPYILCGLCVGAYEGYRRAGGALPRLYFKPYALRIFLGAVGSILFFWVLVKVLL